MKLDKYIGRKFYAVEQVDCCLELGFCLNMYVINKSGGISHYANVEHIIVNNWQWDNFKNAVYDHKFIVGKPSKAKLHKLSIAQLDNLLTPAF